MTWGHVCFLVAAVLLFLLAFDVITDTGKVHLFVFSVGLIAAGLFLSWLPLGITVARRE